MRVRLIHTESFRLAAIFAALFIAAMTAFTTLVYFSVDAEFHNQLMESVNGDLGAIDSGYAMEGEHEAREVIQQRMAANSRSDFFLLERNGIKLAGNLPVMAPRTEIIRLKKGPGIAHNVWGRGTILAPGLYAFVGRDVSSMNRTERHILTDLSLIFIVTLILATLGGTIVSRSFLARMDAITRTCRRIMEGRLGDRIQIRGTRDELDRLAMVINEMLDRIGGLMENLRQISSDIAHDLRTPLTRLRHRLERARQEAKTPADHDIVLTNALAETDTILSLFKALLRIAQIESGSRRTAFSNVDLKALLQRVAEIYGPVAEDEGHPFRVTLTDIPGVQGDSELLVQMFANLLENAIRHTPPGTKIALSLKSVADEVIVSVQDYGPGVPAEERAKLFRRFYRLEQSRTTPGDGLGLALVAAIAELHGAKVTLQDNNPGLRVVINFGEDVMPS